MSERKSYHVMDATDRVPVDVAVGVLIERDEQGREGRFLLTSRPEGKVYAGYWEFPGGKLEQGETVEQALRAYTATAAYAGFDEGQRGVLRAGMLADLVMLDRDLSRIPAPEIREAKVLLTMVGGKVVFER